MSVPFQRISNATIADIQIYDPAAERRAASLDVNWDTFFNIGSQEILYQLEFGWWPRYCEITLGSYLYKTESNGRVYSAFNPSLLVKSDQTLIRLDTFKAVEQFYSSLVTDVSNVNEVDRTNHEFALKRYTDEWDKAVQLSNFYNLYQEGGPIQKLEENFLADQAYFLGDRRYF